MVENQFSLRPGENHLEILILNLEYLSLDLLLKGSGTSGVCMTPENQAPYPGVATLASRKSSELEP